MIGARIKWAPTVTWFVHHPDVRATFEPTLQGHLDGALLVDRPEVVIYGGTGGLFVFVGAEGEYKAHVALLRRARGVYGRDLGREAFAYLFGALGAHRCVAEAPCHLPQVASFAKTLGFKRARLDLQAGIEHLVKESA
jgi:hypothetical protein